MTARALHRMISSPPNALLAVVAALVIVPACERTEDDDGGAPQCVSRDVEACTPLYAPTWERVFTETIQPSCGASGSACHAEFTAAGAEGGLVVSDMAATHAALLDGFVVPGDAQCSDLLVRLDIDESSLLMPPGSQPLDEAERCAVAQWIENGAER